LLRRIALRNNQTGLAFSAGTTVRSSPWSREGGTEIAQWQIAALDQAMRVDWLPCKKATGRIAVRAAIGEALRSRSEVPQHLPHEMLTLLLQVNALHEDSDLSS
jgi:hypothetical protein